jgi:hypothetical protein
MVLPPPMQSSLPAGWLAFTGRASNPLDRYKRFQITHPPFLVLAWRKRSFIGCPPRTVVERQHNNRGHAAREFSIPAPRSPASWPDGPWALARWSNGEANAAGSPGDPCARRKRGIMQSMMTTSIGCAAPRDRPCRRCHAVSGFVIASVRGGAAVPWPHYAERQEGVQRLTLRPAIVLYVWRPI